jgi:hypothetical protein
MHWKNQLISSLGAAFALSLMASGLANASPITYDFTVTATDGPFGGTTEQGIFTYNSSSIVPGGSNVATGLLTSLSFTWNGTIYDQTTANTGFLSFDASGNLIRAVFGNDCLAGCIVPPSTNTWSIILVPPGGPLEFLYAVPGNGGLFTGSVTAAIAVAEPGTLALSGLGCALVVAARRSRRNDIRGNVR